MKNFEFKKYGKGQQMYDRAYRPTPIHSGISIFSKLKFSVVQFQVKVKKLKHPPNSQMNGSWTLSDGTGEMAGSGSCF